MNKFGLLDDPSDDLPDERPAPAPSLSERLAAFPPAARRHAIDLRAVDAAAAPHGFTSREPLPSQPALPPSPAPMMMGYGGRRRRVIPTEPTRHLAIRLPESQYDRFVAYADDMKLTYHEALIRLLDEAGR
jgi:hypothetical protein